MLELDVKKAKQLTILISTLEGGGAEGVCVTVANGLADLGWQVELVVLNLDRAVYLSRLSNKVKVVNLGVARARNMPVPLYRYLKQRKPGVVLAFNYEMAIAAALLRKLLTKPYLLVARNINTFSQNIAAKNAGIKQRILAKLVATAYRNADWIINQSQGMHQDLLKHLPELAAKTSVIHNPVAAVFFESYTGQSDVQADPYILCVGRLSHQKAFQRAINAFASLANDFPALRLKFIGQGEQESSLKQLAGQLGLTEWVDFEGFQSNLVPYYQHASLTLLTSLYEGFPNVLVESIACGTPVVALDCPSGPSEIIEPGCNGLLVTDIELLGNAIRTVLTDEKYRRRDVVSASAERFSPLRVVREYDNILLSLHKQSS